jgi:hypothetical protein
MKTNKLKSKAGLLCCFAMLITATCLGQKKDDWALNNAQIGPESPIEIATGSSFVAQVMYPVPDGPLFPLKVAVVWSIAPPVEGITIDASGKITVAANVEHGTTATVHASVAGGKRLLEAKIYVFLPGENPLLGRWKIDSNVVACGEKSELRPANKLGMLPGPTWIFHVRPDFFVGREYGIAAGIKLAGKYELDKNGGTLKLIPQWPKDKTETNWDFSLVDAGKTLYLRPVEKNEDIPRSCSYVLHRL